MLNIAICDDSRHDAEYLRGLCLKCGVSDCIRADVYNGGAELLRSLDGEKYDIIFLDVDMPGENGIEIGKKVRLISRSVIIIFCTSYEKYAVDAFDCEAFGYLLKPASAEKTNNVITRAVDKLALLHSRHYVKTQGKIIPIAICDIYYIECCMKHIIYHTKNQKIEVTGRLSDVLNELQKYNFCQVHQGYIVNLAKICDFKDYTAVLDNGECVPISVRKKTETLLAYAGYAERMT